MAQDVALWGVAYTDVPEVRVPKQGGGMAAFHDVSDTTAQAADVAQGKLFHSADGMLTAGTASGGGGDDGSFKAVIERSGNVASLPADLTSIGNYAFHSCTNLELTSLPSGVTAIGASSFYGCTNLVLTSLPSGVTTIGQNAFQNCTKLALTELPQGLARINDSAFNSCKNIMLTSVPSVVNYVGSSAFTGCTKLALTELPSGVTYIGTYAFHQCPSLTEMSCDGAISTLGASSFLGSNAFPSKLERVSFPNMNVTSLGTAFGSSTAANACQKLGFADIGKTKGIAANAFNNCRALSTLILRRSDAICTLANISAFNNTPMRGYNSLTGTIYVPQALIETYKTASNWSTLYNNGTLTFAAIEGSEYELGD